MAVAAAVAEVVTAAILPAIERLRGTITPASVVTAKALEPPYLTIAKEDACAANCVSTIEPAIAVFAGIIIPALIAAEVAALRSG